jgi:uncharacterized protein YkwD
MPRHARSETAAAASRHRRVRSLHRRPPQGGRTALALGGTVLAAAMGGVFSGVLPPPPGVPRTLVVAGDPASPQAVATRGSATATSVSWKRRHGGSGTPGAAPTSTPPAWIDSPSGSPSPGVAPISSPSAGPTASPTGSPDPLASASAAASAAAAAAAQDEVLALVNAERAANGCQPLTASPALTALASAFSEEMAVKNFFSHTDPSGKTPWDRAAAAGITDLGGENIARGQQTPADVMAAWMQSPGHRANILNCSYRSLGVGVYYGPDGPWWTQDFGF